MSPDLRAAHVQATVDEWSGRTFAWGRHDCAKMLAQHARRFGHRVRVGKAGSYKTALGARAALAKIGCATLEDAVRAVPSIVRLPAAAFALPGDILILPDGEGMGAAGIYLGNGNVLAGHEHSDVFCIQNQFTDWGRGYRV